MVNTGEKGAKQRARDTHHVGAHCLARTVASRRAPDVHVNDDVLLGHAAMIVLSSRALGHHVG